MVIFELVVLMLAALTIAYNEVIVKRYNNFASSTFILLYLITFIFVPLILHGFFGGVQRLHTDLDFLHKTTEQYHFINYYGLAILIPMLFLSFRKEIIFVRCRLNSSRKIEFNRIFRRLIYLMPILGLFIFVIFTGMTISQLFTGGRFSWYANPSANLFMIAISHYFFSVVSVGIFLHLLEKRKQFLDNILFILMLSAILFYSVLSLDRKWIFYFFSSMLGAYFYLGFNSIRIKLKWLLLGGFVFVFVFFSQFLRDYLLRYMTDTLSDEASLFSEIGLWSERLLVSGDISYFYRSSCELVFLTIKDDIISPGAFLLRNLLFFIPSGWSFGIKPEDVSTTFSRLVNGGSQLREGDMPPGFFGIIVASFGLYFSFMFFVLFPFILSKLDDLLKERLRIVSIVLLSNFMALMLFFIRGDDSSAIYFFIFNLLILQIIHVISRLTLSGIEK